MAAEQQRAVTLLTEAVNLLRSPDTTTVPTTRSDPTTASATSSSTTSPQSELNRLFSPYNSRNFIGKSRPSTSSGSKYYWPAPYYKKWKPKETWTHQFVCLPNVDCNTVPNRSEKASLRDAGLGDQRVVFTNKKGGHDHVKQTLESAYPKIEEGGGFQILRSNGRRLEAIGIPPTGYTVPYLKDTLGQAIAYICPLQRELNTQPIVNKVSMKLI